MSRIITGTVVQKSANGVRVKHEVDGSMWEDWFPRNHLSDYTEHVDKTVSFAIPAWLEEKMFGEE